MSLGLIVANLQHPSGRAKFHLWRPAPYFICKSCPALLTLGIKTAIIIALGGALGSLSRYGAQSYVLKLYPFTFPLGTFLVNVSGCLLIGLFYALSEKGNLISPEWRLFLTTGFCGGYTTFSTFAYENANLMRSSDFLYVGLYTIGSVVLGIAAVFLGIFIIRAI